MKVLLVTSRADVGGGPEHVSLLARELVKLGVEVHIAAPEGVYFQRFARDSRRPVFVVPHRSVNIRSLLRMRSFVRLEGFDVVHSHGRGAGLLARALRCLTPFHFVHTYHGLHLGEGVRRRVSLAYERLGRLVPCRQIFVSPSEYREADADGLVRQEDAVVIINGIEVDGVASVDPDLDAPVIAHVSRFNFHKNSEEAIEIFRRYCESLDSARLVVFGEPDDGSLADWAARSVIPENVELLGNVEDLREAMIANGISCLLSTSRWEGLPLALIEAMSIGIPVVASDVVGSQDIVDERVGRVYELGNISSGARALQEVTSRRIFSILSRAARLRAVEEWSSERMAKETLEAYQLPLSAYKG